MVHRHTLFFPKRTNTCHHQHYLIKQKLAALLTPKIHLLDCHLATRVLFHGDAHDARGSFADFDEAVEVHARVAGTHHHLQRGSELFVSEPLLLLLLLLSRGGGHSGFGHYCAFARVQSVLVLVGAAVVVHRVARRRTRLRADLWRQRPWRRWLVRRHLLLLLLVPRRLLRMSSGRLLGLRAVQTQLGKLLARRPVLVVGRRRLRSGGTARQRRMRLRRRRRSRVRRRMLRRNRQMRRLHRQRPRRMLHPGLAVHSVPVLLPVVIRRRKRRPVVLRVVILRPIRCLTGRLHLDMRRWSLACWSGVMIHWIHLAGVHATSVRRTSRHLLL